MRASTIYLQIFLLLTYLTLSNSFKVDVRETKVIETGQNLWRPSHAIQFSNTTFCFQAINVTFESHLPSEQFLCTFDRGFSFVTVNSTFPFCGSRGILSDNQLYCMHKKVTEQKSSSLQYSTVVFTPKNETLEGQISSQAISIQAKPNMVLKEIKFNGGVQSISSEGFYLMAATVINDDNFESPYLFKSVTGFNWTMVEPLPLNQSGEMYLQVQRGGKISVVAKNNVNYHKATSVKMGKEWSNVEYLNTTTPPFSIVFPSDIVVEYAMSNSTPGDLSFFSPLSPKNVSNIFLQLNSFEKPANNENNAEGGISTSYYAASVKLSSAPPQFIVIHDEVVQGKFLLRSTLVEIDDSEEKEYLEEQLMEAFRKKEKEKLLRQKARQESLIMELKIQNRIREADQKRRRNFAEFDRPYIERALENMKHDEEFMIVRDVKVEFTDFESQALW